MNLRGTSVSLKWLSRACALSLALAAVFGNARAETVPPGITEWLKVMQTRSVTLNGKVLVVAYRKPIVTEDMYRHQVQGLCASSTLSKKYSWGSAVIEEIQILNDAMAQGFAFTGGAKGCRPMDKMDSEAANKYLRTVTREVRAGKVQE